MPNIEIKIDILANSTPRFNNGNDYIDLVLHFDNRKCAETFAL